jgi:hypothetical protein
MESYTVTKEQLLRIFHESSPSIQNEDVRLRITKQDVQDFARGEDKYSWYEIVPDFLPEKPKRYVVTSEQFEQILYHEQDKLQNHPETR